MAWKMPEYTWPFFVWTSTSWPIRHVWMNKRRCSCTVLSPPVKQKHSYEIAEKYPKQNFGGNTTIECGHNLVTVTHKLSALHFHHVQQSLATTTTH
jgi:hypothetical protein